MGLPESRAATLRSQNHQDREILIKNNDLIAAETSLCHSLDELPDLQMVSWLSMMYLRMMFRKSFRWTKLEVFQQYRRKITSHCFKFLLSECIYQNNFR